MQVNGMEFTVGADPELFVGHNDKPINAYGLVKGTKHDPFPVQDGACQVDGMALEFNIDPCETKEDFVNKLDSVQSQLLSMIPGFRIIPRCSVEFDEQTFMAAHPESLELGCEPDYCAYTMKPNPRPDGSGRMRTAGGHVHIGGFPGNVNDPRHQQRCAQLIKSLDAEVGVYSILWDHDDKRREMYGKAGAFRPKSYGVEYRTMSNAWIFHKDLKEFVFDGVERALKNLMKPGYKPDPSVPGIINNSDRNHPFFRDNPLVDRIYHIMEA